MTTATSHPCGPLRGEAHIPGDKSVSIRALILGLLSGGETRVHGLLEAGDVLSTAGAVRALGAKVDRDDNGVWQISGVGVGNLISPDAPLDLGNSGTGARLLMGVVAGHPVEVTFLGDASLESRPMGRVFEPLRAFGADVVASEGGRLPITITGASDPKPQSVRLEVPSAQVKSAILLAALNTPGVTEVIEPWPTRDHTEKMLAAFGADISVDELGDGARRIRLTGKPDLKADRIDVPVDISSAAFMIVAASIVPGSEVRLPRVGMNPTRTGILDILHMMGADIAFENQASGSGEPLADLVIRSAPLKGVTPDPAIAPRLIDEFPILFVAAACAEGRSEFRGLGELRVKESDRIRTMAKGLAACGIEVEELDDGLVVTGLGGGTRPKGGVMVASALDHRIAMSLLVLGMVAEDAVIVDDVEPVATSFPDFFTLMNGLGTAIVVDEG